MPTRIAGAGTFTGVSSEFAPQASGRAKSAARPAVTAKPRGGPSRKCFRIVDFLASAAYHFPIMSVTLPSSLDVWRMVTARRSFEGSLPVSGLTRLVEVLAAPDGEVAYTVDFGRDEFGVAYVAIRANAPLTVTCQRTLEPFVLPVVIDTRLGLITDERDEAALPPGYEALLVEDDGRVAMAAVIEDELLLALPLVPVNPDSTLPEELVAPDEEPPSSGRTDNPFAVLGELKKR